MESVSIENMRASFKGMNLSAIWPDVERPYEGLQEELRPFHYYFADKGHVIMAVLKSIANKEISDPQRFESAIPVKTFLKSNWEWSQNRGYLITNLNCDPMLGLLYDESDIEY